MFQAISCERLPVRTFRLSSPLVSLVLAGTAWLGTLPAHAGELPHSADLSYQVTWGVISLNAEQHWKLEGDRYTLSTELKLPLAFKNRRYVSQGRVGPHGLEPATYEDFEVGDPKPRSVAKVDRTAGVVTYGRTAVPLHEKPLSAGLQDINALAYQLMWLGEGVVGKTVPVTNGRNVVMHQFSKLPDGSASYAGKSYPTQRLVSTSPEGGFEVGLAPGLGGLPLRIVRVQDGKTLTFTATQVRYTP